MLLEFFLISVFTPIPNTLQCEFSSLLLHTNI